MERPMNERKDSLLRERPIEDEDPKTWREQSEGSEAWLLLFRVFLYNILFGLSYGSFGILYIEYVDYFDASKGAVGWIISIQVCLYSVLGIFFSYPIEKWGCNRVACFGSLLVSVAIALSSFAPSVTVLYLTQGVLEGIGLGALLIPSSIAIQKHFSRNRALAEGVSLMGYSCGNLIAPHLISLLINQYTWRGALLIYSAVTLNRVPLAMTFWLPKDTTKKVADKPNEKGTSLCLSVFKRAFDFSLFTHLPFALFCISCILQKVYLTATTHHIPGFAVEQGHTISKAAFLTSIQAFANMSFRLFVTLGANVPGVNRIAIFSFGLASGVVVVTLLLTAGTLSYWGIVAGAAVNGLHMACTNTVISVVLVDLMGVDLIGRSIALCNFSVGLSHLISTPLCGFLFDVSGSYLIPFIMVGAAVLLGSVFSICSDLSHKRINGNKPIPELGI